MEVAIEMEKKMEDEKKKNGGFEKYELESAVETLQKAMEIKNNAELMKAIAPLLDKKKKAIKSLDDLRAIAKDKLGDDADRMED